MLSEEKLIEGCTAGDRTAQRQLYEKYSPSLFALCLRYMQNREQAEDILVTGFMAIFEKIGTVREEGSLEGWMKKVMVHTAVSTIRANEMCYSLESDERVLSNAGIASSQNVTYSAIAVRDIMRQVRQLPDGCRTVFNLHEIEGYSYEEITKILKINRGTVASQIARAKKILQEKLKGYR